MANRRWFRLDVGWSNSEWLASLAPGARLSCVELLSYAKGEGTDGRVRAIAPWVFGRRYAIPAEDVAAMLDAATSGNEPAVLLVDGDWVIAGWANYQNVDRTAAERMRRMRERRAPADIKAEAVTRNSHNVTERAGVTRRATVTETETDVEDVPFASQTGRGPEVENDEGNVGQDEPTSADNAHMHTESPSSEPDAAAARRPPLELVPDEQPQGTSGSTGPAYDTDTEESHWRGEAAAAIRRHLWLSKNPPALMVAHAKSEGRTWTMANELSCWRQLARGVGYEAATGAIEHLRAVFGAEPNQPMSMSWPNSREHRGSWNVAVGRARKGAERTAANSGKLGDLLRSIGNG